MRLSIYLLTFLHYASVHMLRMTYSFNKHNIKMQFGIGQLFLGILDSLIYLSLAIATFWRYSIINDKRHTLVCLTAAIPTAVAFSIVPIVAWGMEDGVNEMPKIGAYFFLLLTLGCFGFSQFVAFPLSLTIFSQHFNVKTEGILVGIWSSKSNAGNIIGFFLANFMVYQLHTAWQTPMILCSIFHIIIAILLYTLVPYKNDESQKPITTTEFFTFMKQKWSQTEFKLYILSFSCFKAILYSYQLWTPAFLVDSGYANFSGYVPMVFDISTLFGSYAMGRLYQQEYNDKLENKTQSIVKRYKFFLSSIIISLVSFLYIVVPQSILLYFVLGIMMGVFLGAVYNSLQNNEILHYTGNNPRKTDMLATVNIGIGCCLVGVFQLVIGVFVHLGHKRNVIVEKQQSHNYGVVYMIIAVFGMVAMTLTFARVYFGRNGSSEEHIVEMKEIGDTLLIEKEK